jgi:hypothetical protein
MRRGRGIEMEIWVVFEDDWMSRTDGQRTADGEQGEHGGRVKNLPPGADNQKRIGQGDWNEVYREGRYSEQRLVNQASRPPMKCSDEPQLKRRDTPR